MWNSVGWSGGFVADYKPQMESMFLLGLQYARRTFLARNLVELRARVT
jgi:hypothetical protein